MSAKAVAVWVTSISLLAIAIFAWFGYLANGIAYGDAFGIRGEEAALSLLRARAVRFLALALIAEGFGTVIIVWHVLSDHDRSTRILAALAIPVLALVWTFVIVRSF
jgi:hypothetical protein